jgi:hypothetical protein
LSEPWVSPERLLIAPTLDAQARAGEKTGGDDEGEWARPKATRARPALGERVSKATIWGRASRARRARLKAMAESVA